MGGALGRSNSESRAASRCARRRIADGLVPAGGVPVPPAAHVVTFLPSAAGRHVRANEARAELAVVERHQDGRTGEERAERLWIARSPR